MASWSKLGVQVEVLHSKAAVATQILVKRAGSNLLVDAGDGTLRDLLDSGVQPEGLTAVLLTHGHYDHVGGLHSLLGYLKMKKRSLSLPVFLPRGCIEGLSLLDGFARMHSSKMPFAVDVCELEDGDEFSVAAFRVVSRSVPHSTVDASMPALGYRLTDGAVSVAFTGDCGDSESVRELVKGTDLALVEASFKCYSSESQRSLHLTETLAREIGSLAKEYLLVHTGV
jgi:ribonuclease BN (tRNA processing enzyme)